MKINFPVSILFILDLLLFPMFHFGSIPFKLSYLIIFFWIVRLILFNESINKKFVILALYFSCIIVSALIGELVMDYIFPQMSHSETLWSVSIYLLCVFSFGLGTQNLKFNYNWLIHILFISVFLNFIISFKADLIPGLISFYYNENSAKDLGVENVSDIVNMLRPRGLFGNPNISMLQINIIFLFILISLKKKLIPKPRFLKTILLIILPISLAVVLGSRSELLISLIYSIYLACLVWNLKALIYFPIIALILSSLIYFGFFLIESNFGFERSTTIEYSFDRLIKTKNEFFDSEDQTQGVSRPFVMFEYAKVRFLKSPIFGTGFNSVGGIHPFDESPRYFHNDWFRLAVSSGLIGLFFMFLLIKKYIFSIDALLIVPFILPAITNTFLLSIPSVMFYFFMLAIMHMNINSLKSGENH